MKTNILVLAAGHTGVSTGDNDYPLCLTETDGVSLLERIVGNAANVRNASFTFALRDQDVQRFHLHQSVELLAPDARVFRISDATRGSACTALLAAAHFDPNDPVLVVSANEWVDMDFGDILSAFSDAGVDGGTLIFSSIHPRYSYVRLGDDNLVCEAAQQQPITRNATAGLFYFARAADMVDAINDMIRKDASVNGAFYICPAFNELILKQRRIGALPLDHKHYHPLKSERQVHHFETVT